MNGDVMNGVLYGDSSPMNNDLLTMPGTRLATGMFQSLSIRDFRLLWVSNVFVAFASQMQNIARGWLIYDMTRSPMDLTWVMLSFMLPSAVFSLVGGVIADRLSKKTIMVASNLLNAVATCALAYITYVGEVTFWHFIFFGLFNGTVMALGMPARMSIIPEMVGEENLVNATALQTGSYNVARIIGPILAGMLIAIFAVGDTSSMYGTSLVFFLIAGLYLMAMFLTIPIHHTGTPAVQATRTSPMEDVLEGFRFVRDEKLVLGLMIIGFVPPALGASVNYLLPAFNKEVMGGGPDDLGVLTAVMGIGALGGSVLLARIGDSRGKGRMMFMSAYGWAVAIGVFAVTSNLYAAMLAGAMTAFFNSFFGSLSTSVLQMATPQHIRGRVISVTMMAHAMVPIGVIPVSALAEFVSIEVALLTSSVVLMLAMQLLNVLFPNVRQIERGHQR
jgi:MFS family permease